MGAGSRTKETGGTKGRAATERGPSVSVARCTAESDLGDAVTRCLDGLESVPEMRGKTAFLKVNLMKGGRPERGLNTHPEVVRSVIRWIKSQGAQVRFGDSCGIPGHTMAAAERAGYLELAREEGVEFVNLDSGPLVPVESSDSSLDAFWVSEGVIQADVRVTLPKLKTHTLMGMTGALKNQMGLLPGGTKASLHVRTGSVDRLAEAIVEINRKVPFHLGLLDGGLALEGGGSRNGRPRWLGYVAASTDLLALDVAACVLMGWPPSEIPSNRAAERMGLGAISPETIRWEGDPIAPPGRAFKRPARDPKFIPFVSKVIYGLRARCFRPKHASGLCRECGKCKDVCPTGAVTGKVGSWIRREECVYCLACTAGCAYGALTARPLWYLRPWLKSRMDTGETP